MGLDEGVFVGAGAVDGGDGDLEEAQVDGELAAVVIPVVEHDVADQLDARDREDFLAICFQAPGCGGCGFGQAFDELLGGLYAALEGVENLFLIFGLLRGEGGRIDFVHVVLGDPGDAGWDGGNVIRELAEGHGFRVRRPVEFVGWDAIENAAGGGGFSLEFIEHGG